ncbi:DgyrCDS13051 [Dimorphilus gyrociliatus]|uniref:DgyrCDS13051 n=1 Tax=Dimorphilus gyrociliatus TaxID=2664684 RepID=A0A7I8W9H2_9ANNE|nr:DgyrCDS13051 [Dimorphilus gyrociliatus]
MSAAYVTFKKYVAMTSYRSAASRKSSEKLKAMDMGGGEFRGVRNDEQANRGSSRPSYVGGGRTSSDSLLRKDDREGGRKKERESEEEDKKERQSD